MKVCLITTSQPSANPRLVKEADALVEAGHDVRVIAAHRVDWATDADQRLLATRLWKYTFIDWRENVAPSLYWKTRVRHFAARQLQPLPVVGPLVMHAACDRLTPELTRSARRIVADLYVAHNPGALPAAAAAARRHKALLGFDAEDHHSGEFASEDRSPLRLATEHVERRFIPRCDYVTAASPGIAAAYEPLCRNGLPTVILNVFNRSARPAQPRPAQQTGPLTLYWFSQTIGPDRGLEDIVSAMGRLPEGSVELHLRGRWHAGYENELRQLAKDARVDDRRIVAHPPADADDMIALAAEFDVGLATETIRTPNRRIVLTNKIFTYLLAGVPVLATRTPAQAAVADSLGPAAQSYEPGHVAMAAEAVNRWLTNRPLLEAARRAAWIAGDTQYNWDLEKHKYLRVIDAVSARLPQGAASRHEMRPGELHA